MTLHKDGNLWTNSAFDLVLSTSNTLLMDKISGTKAGGVYTFSNLDKKTNYYIWEDGSTPVYTNSYTSDYFSSRDVNYYTVTFKSQNGIEILNTQLVPSGKSVTYGGTTPSKADDDQYTYQFSNWVTENGGSTVADLTAISTTTTVYPSFTQISRGCIITWMEDSFITIDTSTVAYGATPTHAKPAKTGYIFASWEPTIVSVIAEATYTAKWTADTYGITYNLNSGTIAMENPPNYTIESNVISLNPPTRVGYSFVGWTGSNGVTAQTSVTIPTGSTGEKSYTANWKSNAPLAPTASIVTAKTDTTLTITTALGYEYSLDNGVNWSKGNDQNSYTFTGLTYGTSYNLICRKAKVTTVNSASAESDASLSLSVNTKQSAPKTPSLVFGNITENSVMITAVAGAEYSKDNGGSWQLANVFIGLDAGTSYTFSIRVKETDNTVESASASQVQYTAAATPNVGEGYSIGYIAEQITVTNGYEVNTDASFGNGTAVANNAPITPGNTYYVRVAATGTVPGSTAVSFAIDARPTTPTIMTVDKNSKSITVTTVAGQEYKIGSEPWQDGGSFTSLSANKEYTVYSRVKGTNTQFASKAYLISVTTKSDGSVTVPTPSVVTYNPSKSLKDIKLLDGWTWSNDTIVPTVSKSDYTAVYTPADAETVDYSGLEG